MSINPGLVAFKVAFQLTPIILTGGIAGLIPGGMLPILSITEALNFTTGILSGSDDLNFDNYFANFRPISGGSLIDYQYGKYPFANQAVAANAGIAQPLHVSMMMICPARGDGGYANKTATLLALQSTLAQHSQSGGTYIVATPSYFYTNMLLDRLTDVTPGGDKQPQSMWQFDFEQPLLSLDQAAQAENSLMSKISSGTAVSGDPSWSGTATSIGQTPTLATPAVVPAASGAAGAGSALAPSLQNLL